MRAYILLGTREREREREKHLVPLTELPSLVKGLKLLAASRQVCVAIENEVVLS